jgi:beta-N-acetylhexosaminidase
MRDAPNPCFRQQPRWLSLHAPERFCYRLFMHRVVFCTLLFFSLQALAKDRYLEPGQLKLDGEGVKWAEKTLKKMSLEEKIGQLFMVMVRVEFMNSESPEYLQLRDTIRRYHIGSVVMSVPFDGPFLYRNQPYEAASLLNRLQRESKLPLLVAADLERGVSMRLYGAAVFPHAMAFGAAGKTDYAERFGRITAGEARAVGVHWNFFPDADVNSNPLNPIINTRSFGEDPSQVGDLVAAYIKGAHAAGMLTTAKHFPGHGDTGTDSHLGVAQVNADLARLETVELPPFRRAIEAGVDAVMVAHVTVPALEPDPKRVATTSPTIASDLLAGKLGFKGIVVTDALDMGALTRLYAANIGRAAVDCFKAGNDLLIIPADLPASVQAMIGAVRRGEISLERLDAAVAKILRLKASVGLHRARLVDLDELPRRVGKPENVAFGQQVADEAVTLVRDNGKVLPIQRRGTVSPTLPYQKAEEAQDRLVVVILSPDVRTDSGRVLETQVRMRVPGAKILYADSRIAAGMTDELVETAGGAEKVIVAAYMVPAPGAVKNMTSMNDPSGTLLQRILARAPEKTVVAAMGNPYLAASFPEIQTYICTFSNATVSEVSVVKALFGETPIRGRLPVTIPGIAPRGAGLDRPANAALNGGYSNAIH